MTIISIEFVDPCSLCCSNTLRSFTCKLHSFGIRRDFQLHIWPIPSRVDDLPGPNALSEWYSMYLQGLVFLHSQPLEEHSTLKRHRNFPRDFYSYSNFIEKPWVHLQQLFNLPLFVLHHRSRKGRSCYRMLKHLFHLRLAPLEFILELFAVQTNLVVMVIQRDQVLLEGLLFIQTSLLVVMWQAIRIVLLEFLSWEEAIVQKDHQLPV